MARKDFQDKMATLGSEQAFHDLLAEVGDKEYRVKCPRSCCSNTSGFAAKFPDLRLKFDLLKWAAEQGWGKPGTVEKVDEGPVLDPASVVLNMSADERASLVASLQGPTYATRSGCGGPPVTISLKGGSDGKVDSGAA